MKAIAAAINQEKALVRAFSVIIHHRRLLIVYSTTGEASADPALCCQVCQYLMWRKSRPENKISAEVEEKVENAIQVWMIRQYQL